MVQRVATGGDYSVWYCQAARVRIRTGRACAAEIQEAFTAIADLERVVSAANKQHYPPKLHRSHSTQLYVDGHIKSARDCNLYMQAHPSLQLT